MAHRGKAPYGMQRNTIRVLDILNSSANLCMLHNNSRLNRSRPQVLVATLPTHTRSQLNPLPHILSLYKESISKRKEQVLRQISYKLNQHSNTTLVSKTLK